MNCNCPACLGEKEHKFGDGVRFADARKLRRIRNKIRFKNEMIFDCWGMVIMGGIAMFCMIFVL